MYVLDDDSSLNPTLREGQASALTVALKEAPDRLWDEQYRNKLMKTLLSQLASQSVNLTQIAIRSCGYLLQYLLINDISIPSNIIVPFVRVSTRYFLSELTFFICNICRL